MPADTNLLIVGNKPSNRWTDQIESETMNVVKKQWMLWRSCSKFIPKINWW